MTNSPSQAAHNDSIVDQFTRQAVPFSRMATQSEELLLELSGVTGHDTVLDVACGPGLVACAFATRLIGQYPGGDEVHLQPDQRRRLLNRFNNLNFLL